MSRTRHSSRLIILTVIGLVLLALTIGYVWHSKLQHNTDHSQPTFTGIVTEDGCATSTIPIGDVGCSIKVDNAVIQVLHGNAFTDTPWGTMINVNFSDSLVGKQVEVYASPTSTNNYTLAGSASYYVKVLN